LLDALKAYSATHLIPALDEEGAKEIGHDLATGLNKCKSVKGRKDDFDEVTKIIHVFPPVSARYEGARYKPELLWQAVTAAQQTGTLFVRSVTGRDMRGAFRRS
jgi:hypothetical protein